MALSLSNSVLTADFHLTDAPLEAYRWKVFENIKSVAQLYHLDSIIIAGDITDRKDRHSAELLNRIIDALVNLSIDTKSQILVISGNHDKPLDGTYYWDFLNKIGVRYISQPEQVDGIWLLPFSANPINEWKDLNFLGSKAIIMHQTVSGAVVDGGRKIDQAPHQLPILPRGIPIFSGDVHRPQVISGITYIGVPHPTRFSEDWDNRVLIVQSDQWKNARQVQIQGLKRAIIDIQDPKELDKIINLGKDDQVRIRFHLANDKLTTWPVDEMLIRTWAEQREVKLVSLEPILTDLIKVENGQIVTDDVLGFDLMKPADVVRTYAQEEKLDTYLLDFGLSILQGVQP